MSTEVALAVSSGGERIEDWKLGRVAQVVNPIFASLRYLQWDSKSPVKKKRRCSSLQVSFYPGMIGLTSTKVES